MVDIGRKEHLLKILETDGLQACLEQANNKEEIAICGPIWKYGDFITLKPGAEVYLSGTSQKLSQKKADSGDLWAVDDYESESGMLNINRVLRPYPGAYCSWVHEKDVTPSF